MHFFWRSTGRIVVSVSPEKLDDFVDALASTDVEFSNLGSVTEGEILIDEESFGSIQEARNLYDNALDKLFAN